MSKLIALLITSMMVFQVAFANPVCKKVFGDVIIEPEPFGTCTVDDGSGAFLGNPTPFGQPGCFTITLQGSLQGSGFSGLTRETVLSPETGGVIVTPGLILADGTFLGTSRAQLTVFGTIAYTRDVIVTNINGNVTQQIVITGTNGQGPLADATGVFSVLDDFYFGELCR